MNRKGDQMRFDIRIGINTGPVVAGVVGSKKFSYDIWGDTVNVASRMEGMSEAGKINISENTYELVKDSFECEYRGEIAVKNRGSMKMYFVGNAVSSAGSLSSTPTSTSA
jgi:class 3 adenylate cyclase